MTLKDEELFAFAGICDTWHDRSGKDINSFSIITTTSNALVSKIHDRMPVILSEQGEEAWLNPDVDTDDAKKLLRPFPAKAMKIRKISTLINNPRNDVPEVLKAV
ncbi:MAG: SOS response-associated peptidase family protein [Candidatus Moranbacteria bacterium]|nr:SOS response-associated peptidase family protein [Candidatus Moranbacteria bacterium]